MRRRPGRATALWIYLVYTANCAVGRHRTAITSAGTRAALLTGAAACLVAAGVAALVAHPTPHHPDAALTDIDQNRR